MQFEHKKPAIQIFINTSVKSEDYVDVLYGIEEEGVLFERVYVDEKSSIKLGVDASKSSNLMVGFGISVDDIDLCYSRSNEPIFTTKISDTPMTKRAIGANAARLVKKIPFKPLTQGDIND